MDELLQWLRQQTAGVRVFSQFCEKALALRGSEPQHAAMARLLATLAGNFSEAYFSEPLPLDVAERALVRLTALVENAVRARAAGLAEEMSLLNELAMAELI
ncbi:MAG TPA: hypothetical protein VH678_31475 [Xanthobacteraceae bacterium]|jgi:hypothetical protein